MNTNDNQIVRKYLLGVPVDFGYTMSSFLTELEKMVGGNFGQYVSTTNPEFVMLSKKQPEFLKIIKGAQYSVPDGTGILLAAEFNRRVRKYEKYPWFVRIFTNFIVGLFLVPRLFFGLDIGERITGVSLLEEICKLSSSKGYTIYFLGGWPLDNRGRMLDTDVDLASLSADYFRDKYPGVNIVGSSSQFSHKSKDDVKALDHIHSDMASCGVSQIDFMFLCYPQFDQEKWIVRNSLNIPAKVSIGVGRSFNYYTKYMELPSEKIKNLHLEWLYTLIKNPWRLKRIIQAFPVFPFKVYLESLGNN